jgi:hypothetical protein
MARWLVVVGLAGCVGLDDRRCEIEEVVLERVGGDAWSCGVGYDVAEYGPACLIEGWSTGANLYWLSQSDTEGGVRWEGNVLADGVLWVIGQENVGGDIGPVEARRCARVLDGFGEVRCDEVAEEVEVWCEPR